MLDVAKYAARLSRLYQQTSSKIAAKAAECANQWANELAEITDINLTGALATQQPEMVTPADIRAYVQALNEAGEQALAKASANKEQLSAALAHHDHALDAFNAAALALHYDSAKVQNAIDAYFMAVNQRAQQLLTKLAETRYEEDIYRRMLTADVLNTEELAALLNELIADCVLEYKNYWQAQANKQDIILLASPPVPCIEVAELVELFLNHFQLQWERPSMIKKVMRVLSQERFPEQIQAEVAAGQVTVTTDIMRRMDLLREEMGQQWVLIAQSSVATWLQNRTGMTQQMCLQQIGLLSDKQKQLNEWIAKKDVCLPESVFIHWQEGLERVIVRHVSGRLK